MDPAVLALAVVAGAVAAVNPCGFALLPAYLTVLVAPAEPGRARAGAVLRAVRFTAGMTAGFVAVFGAFALVVTPLALSVERWLPVVTLVVGVALVAAGAWLLAGRALPSPRPPRAGRAPGRSVLSQAGYGVTFALASLSCTLAPFLAVTASGLRTGSATGLVGAFVAYAAGMGAVVGVLALGVATASASVVARARRVAPLVSRAAGLLLVLAGAYVAWYGWFELRVLAGDAGVDPVVAAAVSAQAALARWVASLGALPLTGLAVLVALAVPAVAAVRRRTRVPAAPTEAAPTEDSLDAGDGHR